MVGIDPNVNSTGPFIVYATSFVLQRMQNTEYCHLDQF